MFPTVCRSLELFFFPITQWRDKLSSKGLNSSEITEIEIRTNQKSKSTLISKFTQILSVFKPINHLISLVLLCLPPYFDLAVRLALLSCFPKFRRNTATISKQKNSQFLLSTVAGKKLWFCQDTTGLIQPQAHGELNIFVLFSHT